MIYIIGLILAIILIAIFRPPATRACRWREYPGPQDSRWHCVACGAETRGPKGKKPKMCLRDNRK